MFRGRVAQGEFLTFVNVKPICTSCRNFLGHIDATQKYRDEPTKAESDSQLHSSYFNQLLKYEQDVNESPKGYVRKTVPMQS